MGKNPKPAKQSAPDIPNRWPELRVELVADLLLFAFPYGAEQMNLPHNFWLGLSSWVFGTAIAVRMFWIFPAWSHRLTSLEKSLMALIGFGLFWMAFYRPIETAYINRNGAVSPTVALPSSPQATLGNDIPHNPSMRFTLTAKENFRHPIIEIQCTVPCLLVSVDGVGFDLKISKLPYISGDLTLVGFEVLQPTTIVQGQTVNVYVRSRNNAPVNVVDYRQLSHLPGAIGSTSKPADSAISAPNPCPFGRIEDDDSVTVGVIHDAFSFSGEHLPCVTLKHRTVVGGENGLVVGQPTPSHNSIPATKPPE